MSSITKHYCDVCKKEAKVENKSLPVIFTTEQTEGRSTKPYLSDAKLDICEDCKNHITTGNFLWAHGAMGYNTYYFKNQEK
ncbi:MAG: hypothetical protein HC840_10490 [Leptolyngbyaceae cyanobacterium RM2_2_4]|nr:hypothetical protein [Leptolyngbyaceae cyanobacterium RM2_2_4]